jgi:hypothetical protein
MLQPIRLCIFRSNPGKLADGAQSRIVVVTSMLDCLAFFTEPPEQDLTVAAPEA